MMGSTSGTSRGVASQQQTLSWLTSAMNDPETIFVGDTISVDGRFVLYKFASQIVKQQHQERQRKQQQQQQQQQPLLLWLNCSSITEQQVAITLKKMGCDDMSLSRYIQQKWNQDPIHQKLQYQNHQQQKQKQIQMETTTTKLSEKDVYHSITIESIPLLINEALMEHQRKQCNQNNATTFDEEDFIKHEIYQGIIKRWLNCTSSTTTSNVENHDNDDVIGSSDQHGQVTRWIVIEDVTALSNLVGDRLVYALIHSIHSLSTEMKHSSFGLIVRCSIDNDYEIAKSIYPPPSSTSTMKTTTPTPIGDNGGTLLSDWIGAGGKIQMLSDSSSFTLLDRALVELADVVIDVVPLATGYSRDIHGRLLVTQRNLESKYKNYYNNSNNTTTNIYNYFLTDTDVHTIPINALT